MGTASYDASASPSVTFEVDAPETPVITVALTAFPTPVAFGQSVTFVSMVAAPSDPVTTGNVAFYDGTTLLGTSELNSMGIAAYTAQVLPQGLHSITAVYTDTGTSQAFISSPVTVNVNAAKTATGTKRSIRNWVTCDGVTDDAKGVAQAFAAAANNAFILEVDCPVFIHIGMDVARPVFVDNDTTVEFTQDGLFIVDNTLIPAFVIANTSRVRLLNWNIEYIGSLPLNYLVGYYDDGQWVAKSNYGNGPSMVFNDETLKQWLTDNRGIKFDWGNPAWAGPTDMSSIFMISGSSSDIDVESMKAWVPKNAGVDHFIPMLFASIGSQASNQEYTFWTPIQAPFWAVPSNLTFSGISLDGAYFGFQGAANGMKISNVVSYRYGDLQDASGSNVGGVNLWFSPPHLFYFNYDPNEDPALANQDITIENVMDYGQRVGAPRVTSSGNCYSLKLGAIHGNVSNYISFRPDGFMDVLPSTGLTVSGTISSYDSSLLDGAYPLIRFPSGPYHQVTFTGMNMEDIAGSTADAPVWGNYDPSNTQITFSKTYINLNQWTGKGSPGKPYFAGTGNNIDIDVSHQ